MTGMETQTHRKKTYTVEHAGIGRGWFVIAHYPDGAIGLLGTPFWRTREAGPYTSKAQALARLAELQQESRS